MAYIGYQPSQLATAPFAVNTFTGDGSTTTFTLSQSVPGGNEAMIEVVLENVIQSPIDAYTVGGATSTSLVFSEAPISGGVIYVIHKGEGTYNLQPASGSVTSSSLDPVLRNFTVDTYTGNGSATTYTLTDTPYSANSIIVTVDGIVQTASTNYSVSGTTLSFGTEAPASGAKITVVHMGFSTGNKSVADGTITPGKISTGGPSWSTTGSLTVAAGTASKITKNGTVTSISLATGDTYSDTASLAVISSDSGATAINLRMYFPGGYYWYPFAFGPRGALAVGGATPASTGAGITFPASQVASSDVNTLDDYEEGTWTPVLKFGGGSTGITTSQQYGQYTKIGRLVTCTFNIFLTNKGSSTGVATIDGLPFTVLNGDGYYAGTMLQPYKINFVNGGMLTMYVDKSSNNLVFQNIPDDSSANTSVTNADFSNDSQVIASFIYYV
jgi:hypothetical protein